MKDRRLPPLPALRAFEAAARHLSFTRAANELGMTQAAVSYQVRLLEEKLGVKLFLRRPRKVTLTDAGSRLAGRAGEAFDALAEAISEIAERADETLVISCNTTFATTWLGNHIGDFQMKHPALAVRLIPYNFNRAFGEDDVDVAIVAGTSIEPGLAGHLLVSAAFTPMLSPGLAESVGGIRTPADILALPIIGPDDPWWMQWFAAAGIENPDLGHNPVTRMGAQMLEAHRAIAGQGVAILTPFFYRDVLARGDLIQPFDLQYDNGEAWHLVYPERHRNQRKIRLFRDWLLPQMPDAAIPPAPAFATADSDRRSVTP
ncbi:LysR family glycine cleavage system transcriptional activator [Rhodobium orientis]|uniref:LysR family transcriptional regulator n=1 Tax=Rhodobium orientis TaxID=34017 RepID=A0A327JNM6_9HYPH|nr:LysR substrate-binding domain-containing protein [Rhodobium orientis]MBB4304214.1 LysR family glycine cleavage system transcriptional activator [Rhodobium orientis]MBK5950684.1 LysR family transcriptional regulator [Rhodobium orientis]RAI28060.1 LysR family transcriptional regulator [Rhodobium orientis]